jgi:tetratricopeptide (TPR) repeat protein
MKSLLTPLTLIFILSFTAAAQSGRNKELVPSGGETPNSFVRQKTLSSSERVELDREMQKGVEVYLSGQHEEAGKIFIKVIEADERHQRAWFFLGMAYARLYQNKEANKAFAISEKLPLVKPSVEADGTYKSAEFTSVPRAAYTELARRRFVAGTIKVAVELGADGKVLFVYPMNRLESGLTENALDAAREIKFIPAQKNGKPVASVRTLVYTFGIP